MIFFIIIFRILWRYLTITMFLFQLIYFYKNAQVDILEI